jgi:hypothetical protein
MRSSWLYFAIRSERQAEPVLISPVFNATARSAMVGKDTRPHYPLPVGTLKIFPNPAQHYVIVEYNFPQEPVNPQNLNLSVFANDGKRMFQRKITKTQDQLLIDCRNLSAGTYLCKMNDGKKTVGSGQFVIAK